MADPTPLRASIALAAYAESLVDGGRVIVFGDATSSLPERLLERGARLVHVYDDDPSRVAVAAARNTSRAIAYAPLGDGGLAVRDGSFDVAIVESLTSLPRSADLLRHVERAVGARGIALIACPNADAGAALLPRPGSTAELDYYGLYDAVAERFAHVRMLGQTPFVGYAVVDFGQTDDPAPAFDAGFVPGGAEDPEWFVALASQRDVELEPFSIIQLPFAEARDDASAKALRGELLQARAAERQARDRMAELEAQQLELGRRRRERTSDAEALEALKQDLAKRDRWIAKLEERAAAADARADEAQTALDALEARAATAERARDESAKRLDDADRARGDIAKRLDEAERARSDTAKRLEDERERSRALARTASAAQDSARLTARIAELEAELARAAGAEADGARDVERLEAQLAERGAEIQRLEATLREAQRAGRDLLRALADARAAAPAAVPPPPPAAVPAAPAPHDGASTDREARLEADLVAAEWTIGRLLGKLEGDDATATAELVRELHEARAALQRQSVLLDQCQAVKPSALPAAPGAPPGAEVPEPER